jgi:hypothetical protein
MNIKFKQWDCILEKVHYQMGGTALKLTDINDGSPVAVITKWLEGIPKNHVAIDVNNCGSEIITTLAEAGVIKPKATGFILSGYCEYPCYELTE